MIEVEIQKLTAAIENLTKVVQEMARPTLVVTNGTPTNVTTLEEAERSYREDNAARLLLQVERERRQAELDQQMADVHKAASVNFDDEANRKLMQAQRDEQLANLYKAEQVKAIRNEQH